MSVHLHKLLKLLNGHDKFLVVYLTLANTRRVENFAFIDNHGLSPDNVISAGLFDLGLFLNTMIKIREFWIFEKSLSFDLDALLQVLVLQFDLFESHF